MAPNNHINELVPPECEQSPEGKKTVKEEDTLPPSKPTDHRPKAEFLWVNIVSIIFIHAVAIYGFVTRCHLTHPLTYLWGGALGVISGFGVTAGAHRLWAHRSYKAKWPLRAMLAFCFSIAGQNNLYDWVRDHRVHHKFSETDADPHNANRGFFFSHVGWLMQKKHPLVIQKGRQIDMTDILDDPIVSFHTKYFTMIKLLMCFAMPIAVPYYFWGESFVNSVLGIGAVRYVLALNFTWLVNSAAHIWGNKPYDTRIGPAENMAVAFLALGEGWHNYHHVFPWDYKAAELGGYMYNITTMVLDIFAKLGLAYDMKTPSRELVEQVSRKYGDGSHHHKEVDMNGRLVDEEEDKKDT